METIDYNNLYKIQDEVLSLIFEEPTELYLTGGTCLSRFYYAKRYSLDLDFFANSSNRFHFIIRSLLDKFSARDIPYNTVSETKDFIRLLVRNDLQVDFINDRVKYAGKVQAKNSYNIDNVYNILANKVTAILSRDNIKDVFDIYLIAKYNSYNWTEIIKSARDKMTFGVEEFCDRLASFPRNLIHQLDMIDADFLLNFDAEFDLLIDDVVKGKANSLLVTNNNRKSNFSDL
ncbi:MAG: nucleotidyl transferase AbiEii/AbiGii toxin family protein [Candidatus Cloacimonetes bacterium]|nr:nucleotidyl transferase AbiEii/AbiGii toxin family protein [Candidatus Cloacimonadota bacterium]